jgi:Leucine-rich repeat (LRR) protein
MGNTAPTNRTGKKETKAKLEKAQKLGILSLSEHGLESLPPQLFTLTTLRTLDLSDNKLLSLGRLHLLQELKSLNLDGNQLLTGSLGPVSSLNKLQTLSVRRNSLGSATVPSGKVKNAPPASAPSPLPPMPPSLKQLYLSENPLGGVPDSLLTGSLIKLELLDLSKTGIRDVPLELVLLSALQEVRLDDNHIAFLPPNMGQLKKLKVLSLRNNKFRVTSTIFTERNPQPLPSSLFTDTALIDLNLHGNDMTNTQLNQFDGFQQFLDRRQKVKSKTLNNLSLCGLH